MSEPNFNDLSVLIMGVPASGKTASLRNIANQENWLYLNAEGGKRLPFKNSFQQEIITDAYQAHEAIEDAILAGPSNCHGVILDTITFYADIMEQQIVSNAVNTQKAWGDFAECIKDLMLNRVARANPIPFVCMAHIQTDLDEKTRQLVKSVPIKGSVGRKGFEAYFTTAVEAMVVTIDELESREGYDTNLLQITDDEREDGYKHVFKLRAGPGERIRAPMGMFDRNTPYMDNDVQKLLTHMAAYYAD